MNLNSAAITLAVLGAASELLGLALVIREIGDDRNRARSLLDKTRSWRPANPGAARRVHASQVEDRFARMGLRVGGGDRTASQIASLATAHNQLVHDSQEALDLRTAQLLEQIDEGDKALTEVLRELLRGSVTERYAGVVALGLGIALSMVASILSSLAS